MKDSSQSQPASASPSTRGIVPDSAADDSIDLIEAIRVLWHNKLSIVFCMLIVSGIAGYYVFRVAEPRYATTTKLALEVRSQQVVDLDSIVSGVSTEEAAIRTELEVLTSRPLIEKLIADLDLDDDPEFNPVLGNTGTVTRIKQLIRSVYGVDSPDPSARTEDETLLDVAENVRDALSASSQRNTYILNVTATSNDPEKSAMMANRLAEIYLADQVANKFAASRDAVEFLSKQVQELEAELNVKEDAIKTLRSETELISPEALEVLRTRAKDLRSREAEAVINVSQLSAELEALTRTEDRMVLAATLDDPLLQRLLPRIVAGDVDAQASFDARVEVREQQLSSQLERAQVQQASLSEASNRLGLEIDQQNADLLALNQLEQDAEATRILYETFLTRLKETSIQIGLQKADSRIMSSATPGQLVAPRKTLIVAAGLVLGGLLGVGIALLRQMQNHGVRTPSELEQLTGGTVLAQIPKIKAGTRRSVYEYLRDKPTSAAAEAVRNLRTSILMSNIDGPPKVVVMTSSVPGEGKTTQAIALTLNFAALGGRVLLIEGDVRRQTLSKYFDTRPSGGITEVLVNNLPLEDALIKNENGFDLLMAGKLRGNAADLFASKRFGQFIKELRGKYDHIIIDTPPVLVVPDARVIGAHADAIIYSVKWDQTVKNQVVEGQKEFDSVGVPVTGFVLSQIDMRGMKRYGYGERYGSYSRYGSGYYDAT